MSTVPNDNDKEWEIDNLPNRLTLFRIFLIPVVTGPLLIIGLQLDFLSGWEKTLNYMAAWTFVLASITDFFDGHFARLKNLVTVFGSFLDPIADKFLVVSALIILQGLGRLPVLLVVILVLRELYMTSLRLLAAERGFKIPVGKLGKWKTTFQMIGIPLLMANDEFWGFSMAFLGSICIYLAGLFSLYSAIDYSIGLVRKIRQKRKRKKDLA